MRFFSLTCINFQIFHCKSKFEVGFSNAQVALTFFFCKTTFVLNICSKLKQNDVFEYIMISLSELNRHLFHSSF
jgi:hypothetical protein